MNVQEKIHAQVNANAVVLHMKGTPQFPQCGFSGATVQLLRACGLRDFAAIDVLADPDIRTGIKAYANGYVTVRCGNLPKAMARVPSRELT